MKGGYAPRQQQRDDGGGAPVVGDIEAHEILFRYAHVVNHAVRDKPRDPRLRELKRRCVRLRHEHRPVVFHRPLRRVLPLLRGHLPAAHAYALAGQLLAVERGAVVIQQRLDQRLDPAPVGKAVIRVDIQSVVPITERHQMPRRLLAAQHRPFVRIQHGQRRGVVLEIYPVRVRARAHSEIRISPHGHVDRSAELLAVDQILELDRETERVRVRRRRFVKSPQFGIQSVFHFVAFRSGAGSSGPAGQGPLLLRQHKR